MLSPVAERRKAAGITVPAALRARPWARARARVLAGSDCVATRVRSDCSATRPCDDTGPVVADAGATSAPQPGADVTLTSAASTRPRALWAQYKAIHADATLQNALATGQQIDGLLSEEAREVIGDVLSDSNRRIRPEAIREAFALDIMRQRILGESAAVRRDRIAQYSVGSVDLAGEHATLHIYDGSKWIMDLPVVLEHGAWRFEPSDSLLPKYDELYPLPDAPSRTIPRTYGTPQAAARALARAMNDGTAWHFYDLLDSTTKAKTQRALDSMGASEEKMLRVLENALRVYRADFGTAFVASVTQTSPDRARVVIAYSKGRTEYYTAVLENDSWRIQMMI